MSTHYKTVPEFFENRIESIVIKRQPNEAQLYMLSEMVKHQPPGFCKIKVANDSCGSEAFTTLALPRIQPNENFLLQLRKALPQSSIFTVFRAGRDRRRLENEIDPEAQKELIDRLFEKAERGL